MFRGLIFIVSSEFVSRSPLSQLGILLLCGKTSSYVTLLLVYFKYLLNLSVKLLILVSETIADVLVNCTFAYAEFFCSSPNCRFILDYVSSKYNSTLFMV